MKAVAFFRAQLSRDLLLIIKPVLWALSLLSVEWESGLFSLHPEGPQHSLQEVGGAEPLFSLHITEAKWGRTGCCNTTWSMMLGKWRHTKPDISFTLNICFLMKCEWASYPLNKLVLKNSMLVSSGEFLKRQLIVRMGVGVTLVLTQLLFHTGLSGRSPLRLILILVLY